MDVLKVCLFGGEIGRMENFGEKIEKKMNFCVIWFREGERKLLCGAQVFSNGPTKLFSPKWRENRGENVEVCYVTKIPSLFMALTYPSHFLTSRDLSTLLLLHPYLSVSSQQLELQVLFFLFLFCIV